MLKWLVPLINFGTLWKFTILLRIKTLRNLTRSLHRKLPEPHHASSPRPETTGTCTGNFRNLTRYLHQNPLEPNQVSAPQPSGTSPRTCTGNFRNLTRYLHGNPPGNRTEPSGAWAGIFTGTLRNLTRYLHRNPPEPHEVSAPEPSGTLSASWSWSCTGSHRS